MKKLPKKYIDVLEGHSWYVSSYTDDGRVEIEGTSPAGEDLIICVDVEGFPEALARYAADFDPDEHVEMWIEARRSGTGGIPTARELVHDAEAIDRKLEELAEAVTEAAEKGKRRRK